MQVHFFGLLEVRPQAVTSRCLGPVFIKHFCLLVFPNEVKREGVEIYVVLDGADVLCLPSRDVKQVLQILTLWGGGV